MCVCEREREGGGGVNGCESETVLMKANNGLEHKSVTNISSITASI